MRTKSRCAWVTADPLYIKYHDTEWGRPVYDDRVLFEFLILEGAQAGLNWLTVLKKRENYRQCFSNFNPELIAKYDTHKLAELINNPGIIRNKLKIQSAITNAQIFLKIQKEYKSFSSYLWNFVDNKPVKNNWKSIKQVPATSDISDKLSKDLKKRGFKFVGSTICYAYMQAIGMVNDHAVDCFVALKSTH
ncbi:MAG TPA: DNA-3-methyladenine glycosylase I [Gammaproteobacteria bacterium]|nr:DNA-3-methyladenine glycosylase I [Gammaproteobacteria bacterium]